MSMIDLSVVDDIFDGFDAAVQPPAAVSGECWWFVLQQGRLLVREDDSDGLLPLEPHLRFFGLQEESRHYLGRYQGRHCFVVTLARDSAITPGYCLQDPRALLGQFDSGLFAIAGRALQIAEWHRTHRYCGVCGSAMVDHPEERARCCPECSHVCYPRISPCVIVLIARDREILLAQGVNFHRPFYSTLAGFMEPGETAEQAVHREVAEEVGIRVCNLRYVSSQPWPFPHSLMLGFHADYAGGEITPDPAEIADARWWSLDALPAIPPKGTIARLLIDQLIDQYVLSRQ